MKNLTRSLRKTSLLKPSPMVVALLALSIAAPAFAQGGGGGNGGGGGRNRNNNNNVDVTGADTGGGNNNGNNGGNNNGNNGGGGRGGRGRNNNNNGNGGTNLTAGSQGGGGGPNFNGGGAGPGGGNRNFGRNNFTQLTNTEDYGILTTTSIFARNRIAIDNSASDTPAPTPTRQGPAPVFVGVIQDEQGYMAFIESGGEVVPVRVGERINWDNSTVKHVSLDKLQVQTGETVTEIPLGYNMRNEPAQPLPPEIVPPTSLDVGNRGNYATNNVNNNFGGRGGNNFGGNNFGGNFGGGGGRRGGGGGNNFGGNFGGNNFGGGGNNFGGGGGNNFGGNNAIAPTTPIITNDPPLPAGTQDDLAARMRARRAQQVGGG